MEFHFEIRTLIKNRGYLEVFNQFDKKLFNYLSKGQPVKLLRFDGSSLHDQIHILFPFDKKWVSVITEEQTTPQKAYFIDQGKQLPLGLKEWEHQHIVAKSGNNCYIVDKVTYSAKNSLLGVLLFLPIYIPILIRKVQYKSFFSK